MTLMTGFVQGHKWQNSAMLKTIQLQPWSDMCTKVILNQYVLIVQEMNTLHLHSSLSERYCVVQFVVLVSNPPTTNFKLKALDFNNGRFSSRGSLIKIWKYENRSMSAELRWVCQESCDFEVRGSGWWVSR